MKRYHVKDGGWGYEAENGLWVDYDEAHAIEQERDALRVKLDNSRKATDYWKAEINKAQSNFDKLKSELAALKAPPKILKAEEVTERGWYKVKFPGEPWEIVHIGDNDGDYSRCKFIGPIKMMEVCDAG